MLSHEGMFLCSLSCNNKDLEWRTLKPPLRVTALRSWIDRVIALRSRMDHVTALRQISVTALFYLEDRRKIHLRGVRARQSKDTRRRAPQRSGERESWLWLLYLYVSLSLGLSCVNWASQECCFFTWGPHSSPQTFFCSIFAGFSLPCLVATTILDSFSLFFLPNFFF